MPSQQKWDRTFMEMAVAISKMSKDPTTKVGAIIVSPDNTQISCGYNGFVCGINETPEKWERPKKYDYAIHAEENALLFCPFDTKESTIYCTHQCCHRCIKIVKQARIRRVVYLNEYINLEHKDIWLEHAELFDEVVKITI